MRAKASDHEIAFDLTLHTATLQKRDKPENSALIDHRDPLKPTVALAGACFSELNAADRFSSSCTPRRGVSRLVCNFAEDPARRAIASSRGRWERRQRPPRIARTTKLQ